MNSLDRFLSRVIWRLTQSEIGIAALRVIRWTAPRVAPYSPPRAEIPPERMAAFVPVEIRPSTIVGAGLGVFAVEPIAAGVTIGEYTGDIVDSVLRSLRLPNKDYLARTGEGSIYIDSSNRPEAVMRYVNHHPNAERRSVEFRNDGRRKFLVTTRAVAAGEELFVDYDWLYWKLRGITPGAG
jgi:hypothetical protein